MGPQSESVADIFLCPTFELSREDRRSELAVASGWALSSFVEKRSRVLHAIEEWNEISANRNRW
jgi:hypothetical protein